MKAAVVHSFDKPLAIEDVPKPKADSGEVVVKIETCGLCHSDIHAAHGDWPFKPNLPLIRGHEAVGIVESVGNGVKEVKEGDRVAIPWMGYACGLCRDCVSGWETRCEQQVATGYMVDGGYAEYAPDRGAHLCGLPGLLPARDLASPVASARTRAEPTCCFGQICRHSDARCALSDDRRPHPDFKPLHPSRARSQNPARTT